VLSKRINGKCSSIVSDIIFKFVKLSSKIINKEHSRSGEVLRTVKEHDI
jgi:hypothetical protein